MTTQNGVLTAERPIRVWPGVLFAALQPVAWFVIPRMFPEQGVWGLFGTLILGVLILLWWLFFSRAPWAERLGMLLLAAIALVGTSFLIHPSVATAGQSFLFKILPIPATAFALVVGVVLSRHLETRARRIVLAGTILLASGAWALVRFDGVGGGSGSGLNFTWRWSPTREELLVQSGADLPSSAPAAATPASQPPAGPTAAPPRDTGKESPAAATGKAAATTAESKSAPSPAVATPTWPGFRGANRDAVITGVQIATDWSAAPPVQMWRRPVGPAWSSFAVGDQLFYTQEQRGDYEIVSCYDLKTGKPVWAHRDKTRFWEANAGAGPRGTPTLHGGRVYTFGATGIVNVLDAATGTLVWTRNAGTDTGRKVPYWGFASSPLVVGDQVIIAAADRLIAYDLATGAPRWKGPEGGGGYSSPQLFTFDGVEQLVLLHAKGAMAVAPADGTILWQHSWEGGPMVQPAATQDGDLLVTTVSQASGLGIRRLAVKNAGGKWSVQEKWTSIGLKPYFNDYVIHNGHAYGFDDSILSCIDLKDGARKWKGGRYGNGQLVLLADQNLLLVVTEEGELALVNATPDQFTEVARAPALEGKTWNHPALAGDVLLVRNDHEMAAFKLRRTGERAANQ